jgi:photosystem II stability/assembly factor-like uncharacterized protein
MANSTILYACTHEGLAIFNKPGTLPEWLPPRMALPQQEVTSAWAEPGPPIRVLAAVDGALMLSENGGRTWEAVKLEDGGGASPFMSIFYVSDTHALFAVQYDGGLWKSGDGGGSWERLRPLPAEGCVLALEPAHGSPGEFYALVGESDGVGLYRGSPDSGRWHAVAGEGLRDLGLVAIGQAQGVGLYGLTAEGVVAIFERDGSVDVTLLEGSPQGGEALAVITGAALMQPALVVGTQDGVVVSPDGGATWNTPEMPRAGGVTALARDPERRDRLYAALGTGHLVESGNRGGSWEAVNAAPVGPVGFIYVVRI